MITAMRFLAASPKSRKTLQGKLLEKGYPETIIQETLEELEKQHLLNDRQFANQVVSKFRFGTVSGRRKIAFELKKRGIPAVLGEEALTVYDREAEEAAAFEVAENKWGQGKKLPFLKRRKKVYDFLIRRGFDFQIAKDVVDRLAAADRSEGTDF